MKIHDFHQNWHGQRSSSHYFYKRIPQRNRPARRFKTASQNRNDRRDLFVAAAILSLLVVSSIVFWMHPWLTIAIFATLGIFWGLCKGVARMRHTQGG